MKIRTFITAFLILAFSFVSTARAEVDLKNIEEQFRYQGQHVYGFDFSALVTASSWLGEIKGNHGSVINDTAAGWVFSAIGVTVATPITAVSTNINTFTSGTVIPLDATSNSVTIPITTEPTAGDTLTFVITNNDNFILFDSTSTYAHWGTGDLQFTDSLGKVFTLTAVVDAASDVKWAASVDNDVEYGNSIINRAGTFGISQSTSAVKVAGRTITVTSGSGGDAVDADAAAGAGGGLTLRSGTGGAAVGDQNAAAGGTATFQAGNGGGAGAAGETGTTAIGGRAAVTGGTGGLANDTVAASAGGEVDVTGGTGGAAGTFTDPAGDGGAADVTGGVGGASGVAGVGGDGGIASLTGGIGGIGDATPQDAGAGANVAVSGGAGGAAGANAGSNAGDGGDLLLNAGAAGTTGIGIAGVAGDISIGVTNCVDLSLAATDEIDITTTGRLDINPGANLDIDVTGSYDMLASTTFSIDGTGASNVTTDSGDLTLASTSSGDVVISTNAGAGEDVLVTAETLAVTGDFSYTGFKQDQIMFSNVFLTGPTFVPDLTEGTYDLPAGQTESAIIYLVGLKAGDDIASVRVTGSQTSAAVANDLDLTVKIWRSTIGNPVTVSQIGATSTVEYVASAALDQEVDTSADADGIVASDSQYFVTIDAVTNGTSTLTLMGAEFTLDRK